MLISYQNDTKWQSHFWNDIVLNLAYMYFCSSSNAAECSSQIAFIFTVMLYQFWKGKIIIYKNSTYAEVHCMKQTCS